MADVAPAQPAHVPLAETEDVELYHPKSWITRWVFCQYAKVIAITYLVTSIVKRKSVV